ncbi:hypothetical protein SAMN05216464_10898 [Mucilaginibacter pineti]|uniref:Uncharacterized protein n=1 Tax=Mucilaginibacter pineti TaxID=1391627 RepID=A0A1G7ENF5_9SPHI|nr:hypothetical protein SAMN05216464_10898 [Mucilaginibacter pineti]
MSTTEHSSVVDTINKTISDLYKCMIIIEAKSLRFNKINYF